MGTMGRPATQIKRLKELHAELLAALPRTTIPRDAFHRLVIDGMQVGYPQVYSVIKTGQALGLWRPLQALVRGEKMVELLPIAATPTPTQPQAQPETPGIAG